MLNEKYTCGSFQLRLLLTLLSVACAVFQASAQTDSSRHIPEVTITAVRGEQLQTGAKVQQFTPAQLRAFATANLAELLSANTPVFIKSYGPGSLSSISFRGTGASHTAIVWNGFNLQSSMNGQTDLSMFPIGTFDEVRLQYGGNSALYGSGAIGGSIYLRNTAALVDSPQMQVTLQASSGSFGTQQYFGSYGYSGKRFSTQVKYYRTSSDNNYTFTNTAAFQSPEVKQTHAAFTQQGVVLNGGGSVSKFTRINAYYWWHNNQRDLPPTMLQSTSLATQADESHRAAVDFTYARNKWQSILRSGFFLEQLRYSDPIAGIDSKNRAVNWVNELELTYTVSPILKMITGVNFTTINASSPGYSSTASPSQNRTAIFAAARWGKQTTASRFKSDMSVRAENISGVWVPVTFSFGTQTRIADNLHLHTLVSRNYRYPTFNDLYWQPGGNLQLKPEYSFNAESGLNYVYTLSKHQFKANVTVFSHWVDNWIIWMPDSVNPNVWTPNNAAEVWSRGVEYGLGYTWQPKLNTTVSVNALYTWQQATHEKVAFAGDAALHRQLIYMPRQMGSFQLSVQHKKCQFSFQQVYNGLRFTSSDNYNYLPAFWLSSAQMSYSFQLKKYPALAHAFVSAKNIWNENYQVMLWRAMPGRYIEAGLRLELQHKIKHQ